MALLGSIATLRAQTAGMDLFATAFRCLDEVLKVGSPAATRLWSGVVGTTKRIELSGGAFALEQVYCAKPRIDGCFESHRRYIDVQVGSEGEEIMELVETSRLAVRKEDETGRDLIVYADCAAASVLRFIAGEAAIFDPVDGRIPGIRPGTAANLVRKPVIKVPVPA